MATCFVGSVENETAARHPTGAPGIHHSQPIVRWTLGLLLTVGAQSFAYAAELPGAPADETERAWYATFMTRFNARVGPSFHVDPELVAKVSRAWDGMVERLRSRGG